MTDAEVLIIAKTLEQRLAAITNPKNPESIRAKLDAQLTESALSEDGATSRRLAINGRKVGTMTASVVDEAEVPDVRITVADAFLQWLRLTEDGCAMLAELVDVRPNLFTDKIRDAGLKADGVTWERITIPEHVRSVTLKVDGAKVEEALRGELPDAVAGLLAGEGD